MDELDEVKGSTAAEYLSGVDSDEDSLPPLVPGGQVTLRVPGSTDYYRVCRLLVSGLAQRLSLPWDAVEDLKLAVSEGCSLVCGGPSATATGTLEITVTVKDDNLEVVLKGEGVDSAKQQAGSDDDLDVNAMGLFFIESLMEQVDYQVKATTSELRMVKVLSGDAAFHELGR